MYVRARHRHLPDLKGEPSRVQYRSLRGGFGSGMCAKRAPQTRPMPGHLSLDALASPHVPSTTRSNSSMHTATPTREKLHSSEAEYVAENASTTTSYVDWELRGNGPARTSATGATWKRKGDVSDWCHIQTKTVSTGSLPRFDDQLHECAMKTLL